MPANSARRRKRMYWLAGTLAAVIGLPLFLCSCLISCLGGAFTHEPHELTSSLSAPARELIARSFADLGGQPLRDYHMHIVGMGSGGTGTSINPQMRSWWHPVRRVRFAIYTSACGIEDHELADQQYMERLLALIEGMGHPVRCDILAFDKNYGADGKERLNESEFYVPNEYVFELARRFPERFDPVISVHPYRADALSELERWAAAGGGTVKWLPNAMGIDPADPRCDGFYDKMRELGLVLLSHAGEEKAVHAEEAQRYGNPLRLRRALDRGVTVIVAHCASAGKGEDLDDPARPQVSNFDLFLRLMDDPRYAGRVFGEISGITQVNRMGSTTATLLARGDLHSRLVNGSDYPLPAVNVVIWTGELVDQGFITAEERALIDEIYGYNPLLFDFVLKRTLKHPETGARFPPSMFVAHPQLTAKR